MQLAICIALFLPLISFLILMIGADKPALGRQGAGRLACSAVFVSFAIFATILFFYRDEAYNFSLFPWIHVGAIQADFTLCLDHLSLLMSLIITGVGFLIHVYSIGYMDHEKDYGRYFACLNFFVFSMLLLVLAGDLLVLFIGWEGVGLASYLLIGFWYQRHDAAQAAVKAFVVNRIGDLGLLLGLLLTYYLFNSSHIETVIDLGTKNFAEGAPVITALTLLFFVGAMGKSAQIPLQSWLADAMAGPTPVSALIHAATMVTAGVYLVVRLHPLFLLAPDTLQFIGIVGSVTALYAALSAMAQTDLKRVLAYSTVSQLGLMFMACGAGAFYSAMFHLTTHAFVKALLFLSAGSVIHMLHGETQMAKMGGLSKVFKKTHWLFLIGVLALSGIPPFATFFSKDLILEQEYLSGHKNLFYIGLAASILTAYYLTRAYLLTFCGPLKKENEEAQEAPSIMTYPVMILGVLSVIGGFLGFTIHQIPLLEEFLTQVKVTPAEDQLDSGFALTPETWLAISGAFLGLGAACLVYWLGDGLNRSIPLLKNAFYADKIYDTLVVRPLKGLARFVAHFMEPVVFFGSLRGASRAIYQTASGLQILQSSQVRSYVAWMAIGMGFLISYLVF